MERVGQLRLDPLRVAVAVAVWLLALVWVAAVLGYRYGDIYLGELQPEAVRAASTPPFT